MNEKRASHKQRLYGLLSDGAWHHHRELHDVGGWRFGGRLFELRKEGHAIETDRIGVDEYRYRMIVERQLSLIR